MLIDMKIAPGASTVHDYAGDAVRNMQRVYGIQMDYSVASLEAVDRVLTEWRDGGAPVEAVTKSLYAFGSYAGEVLLRHVPGRWIDPKQEAYGDLDSLFLFVKLADGEEWRPITLAFRALLEGPQHSFSSSANQVLSK